MSFRSRWWILSLAALACGRGKELFDPEGEGRCEQTGEFGNQGCAVLVVHVLGLDGRAVLPRSRPNSDLTIQLEGLDPATLIGNFILPITNDGPYRIVALKYSGGSVSESVSVPARLFARWVDRPEGTSAFGTVYAADSVALRLRMAPVGKPFVVDTVVLRLKLVDPPTAAISVVR